jgi:hypothetical protein
MIVTAGQTYCGLLSSVPGGTPFTYMGIGTGTTAAALGQTALVTPAGSRVSCTDISEQSTTVPGDTVRFLGLFTITAQTVVTEIGIFNDDTAGTMLSRIVLSPSVTAPAGSIFVGVVDITASDGGAI